MFNIFSTNILAMAVLLAASYSAVQAEVFNTKERALELAYPGADEIQSKSIFLNDEQLAFIEKKYKIKIDSKLYLINIALKDENVMGYSIVDTHTLRTKSQTIMVNIHPDGKLNYVEILAFYEPPEYKPSSRWLDLYRDKTIDDDLRAGYEIPNISGATISSHGTSEAVKRVMAVFDYYKSGEVTN